MWYNQTQQKVVYLGDSCLGLGKQESLMDFGLGKDTPRKGVSWNVKKRKKSKNTNIRSDNFVVVVDADVDVTWL